MISLVSSIISSSFIERIPLLIKGATTTISVALLALAISIFIGIIFALLRLSKNRFATVTSFIYTTIVRGIPELILMLLIFYGGQQFINDSIANLNERGYDFEFVDLSAFVVGSITIGFIYGAYMAETFRGALLAVPAGQVEAAKSLGLGKGRTFFRIIFPQMIRHALSGIGNNWLVMLKATALVSLISLQDLVKISKDIATATGETFTFYLFAAAIFLSFTAISSFIFRYLERHYSTGFIRNL